MKINRIGTYITGFKYYKKEVEIGDKLLLEKIRKMKIPPAYDNVTIINGKKILAYGYDSKNRKQIIYNNKYIEAQNCKKYSKIKDYDKYFLKIKKYISKDIKSTDEKTKLIAMIITLVLYCGFRIGNKKYEKENNSYGITTLKISHISILDDKKNNIIFDFIGKKGIRNTSICKNRYICEYLSKKIIEYRDKELNEQYIFIHNNIRINSKDVNNYLEDKIGIKITTKDLRTWNANNLFIKFITKSKKSKNPIKIALELTARELHNSPSVCKNSYIDPKIIEYAKKHIIDKN